MPPRTVHLIEAGIVTEQRSAGAIGAPAALAGAFAERLRPEKRVRIPFTPRDRWLSAAREACRTLADAVSSSLATGATPVVLGGNGAAGLPTALMLDGGASDYKVNWYGVMLQIKL